MAVLILLGARCCRVRAAAGVGARRCSGNLGDTLKDPHATAPPAPPLHPATPAVLPLTASISFSGTSSACPTVRKASRTRAASSAVALVPRQKADAACETRHGRLGMTRTTLAPTGRKDSSACTPTPAAMETKTLRPWGETRSDTSRSTTPIVSGLTASQTISAF
eukprot:scaffold7863_cov118-Isochrysis_galbana.AAC.8